MKITIEKKKQKQNGRITFNFCWANVIFKEQRENIGEENLTIEEPLCYPIR